MGVGGSLVGWRMSMDGRSVCVCTHLQYESRVSGVGATMHEDIFWITCTDAEIHLRQLF